MTIAHKSKTTQRRYRKSPDQEQSEGIAAPQPNTAEIVQRAHENASSLSPADVLQLQRTVGNHAVNQMLGGQPVQRLMGLTAFKASTAVEGKVRWKIKTLDRAVSAYEDMKVDAYQARDNQLQVIIDRCNAYLDLPDNNASRKAGVRTLLPQARKEKEVYDLLVLYKNAGGRKAKYDELNRALDSANEISSNEMDVQNLIAHISNKVTEVVADIRTNEPLVLQQMIQEDLAKLRAIANAPNAPALTRAIITEVVGNVGDVHFEEFTPGAKLTTPKQQAAGVAEKYTVNHMLAQGGGTAERIGSLGHELTHVSAGESYDNTSLFLLFDPASSAEQIATLARDRSAEITALKALCTADLVLSARQKSLIRNKLDYAVGDKLGTYVANFFKSGKIDEATKDRLNIIAAAVPNNNTLVEYDTVINQSMIYMQQWNIAQANPFYVKLMQVAQDAYDARAAARG